MYPVGKVELETHVAPFLQGAARLQTESCGSEEKKTLHGDLTKFSFFLLNKVLIRIYENSRFSGKRITACISFFDFFDVKNSFATIYYCCLLYTSPSPRDKRQSRMPSSA